MKSESKKVKLTEVIPLTSFALLILCVFLLHSIYQVKEVQYLNERSKEVVCEIVGKCYRTSDHAGYASPMLSFSFYLKDDETKISDNFTETRYANQIDFDNVKIGDTVLCNITYNPKLYTNLSHKNTLQIQNIEIIRDSASVMRWQLNSGFYNEINENKEMVKWKLI